MAGILQGTTPSLVINVNTDDIAVSDIAQLEIVVWDSSSFEQEYGLSDVTLDTTENTITIAFTETETLSMDASKGLRWQMRCKDANGQIYGTAKSVATSIYSLKSGEVMDDE